MTVPKHVVGEDRDEDYRQLYEDAPCGYVTSAMSGAVVQVNRTLVDLLGRPREELLGGSLVDLMTPGARLFWLGQHAQTLLLAGGVSGVSLDLRTGDGGRLPVLLDSSVLTRTGAEPLVRTTVVDARGRREYERSLLQARREAERLEAWSSGMLRAAAEPVIVVDAEGRVVRWGDAAAALLGWAAPEVAGRPLPALLGQECAARRASLEELLAGGTDRDVRRRLLEVLTGTREVVPVAASAAGTCIEGERFTVVTLQDLRALRELEGRLSSSREMLRDVLSKAPVVVVGVDRAGRCDLAEGDGSAVFGPVWADLVGRDVQAELGRCRGGRQVLAGVRQARVGDGMLRAVQVAGRHWDLAVRERPDGGGLTVVGTDVTPHRHLADALARQARRDPLTGLRNRAGLHEHLEAVVATGEAALVYLDLDGFKDVNDSLGHVVGDQVLRAVAVRLLAAVPDDVLLGRLGGDEFIAVVGGQRAARPDVVAGHMLRALLAPVVVPGVEEVLEVRASAGTSRLHADAGDAHELLAHADAAMYRAKRIGGQAQAGYDADQDDRRGRFALVNRLRLAIDQARGQTAPCATKNHGLDVHFQPVVDIASGSLRSVEALARWTDGMLGVVPPSVFVPAAEASRLIVDLGEFVLERTCAALAQWDLAGVHVPRAAVNVSALQLARGGLLAAVQDALRRHRLSADRLILEVTESAVAELGEGAMTTLEELRARGVLVALDDFGTGQSSLARLRDLPVDVVKLDRSFVVDLPDAVPTALVTAFLGVADALGLATVAEGVENDEQRVLLAQLGCDLAQGYLFCRPVTAEAITAQLQPGAAARGSRRS
jgi:diguanylate cyclase (GGDEF)-like protein/PAS domain S-box-containing protein